MKKSITPIIALLFVILASCSPAQPRPTATAQPTRAAVASATMASQCTVTTILNLRAGPGTADRVIAVLSAGDTLTITQAAVGWARVLTGTGQAGWVNKTYCK